MDISPKYIKTKETIGYLEGDIPVDLLVTFGGLKVLIYPTKKGSEILGAGPHLAIAKFVAGQKYKNIKWIDNNG